MTGRTITDVEIQRTLESAFGFPSFRPLQAEIVGAILSGQDVFALMPTGGGKSLCYQLPALLLDGTTVVVSPLIALMKDQVDALRSQGLAATYINSSLSPDEIARRQRLVTQADVKLLYVAPERLMMPVFLRLLQSAPPALFAIDEAHCISEWGHDFRPEYRELKALRDLFPATPVAAFTATATRRVQADIIAELGLSGAATFQASFNRANLWYEVRPKKKAYADLVGYLRAHPDASGIIYCSSRAGTEDLARRLARDGVAATAYHAGLSPDQRRERQEAFARDNMRVIIATIAFGMGIDKPDVRFVIHYDLPRTLENYYQESGRAGRDGERSDCILFYSVGDVVKLRFFANEKETPEERRIALWQLQQMANWAEGAVCRRRALLAYFDEPFDSQEPPCCDVCASPGTEEDATVAAQMFLSCVKRTGERFGASHVIAVLRGSQNKRILSFGHQRLPTFGIGRERTEDQWRDLVQALIQGGYLTQDPDAFNALRVTERGRAVLFADERVTMRVRWPATREMGEAMPAHPALFESLRTLRKQLADEQSVPPYVIFHDRALREMASALPASRAELLGVPGIGEHKARTYGDPFLAAIADYVREEGATPVPSGPVAKRSRLRGELSESAADSVKRFRQGDDVEQIAAERSLAHTTVIRHLLDAMDVGERLDIGRLVPPLKQRAIAEAFRDLGVSPLKPVLERLGPAYTYDELRIVRSSMALESSPEPNAG